MLSLNQKNEKHEPVGRGHAQATGSGLHSSQRLAERAAACSSAVAAPLCRRLRACAATQHPCSRHAQACSGPVSRRHAVTRGEACAVCCDRSASCLPDDQRTRKHPTCVLQGGASSCSLPRPYGRTTGGTHARTSHECEHAHMPRCAGASMLLARFTPPSTEHRRVPPPNPPS